MEFKIEVRVAGSIGGETSRSIRFKKAEQLEGWQDQGGTNDDLRSAVETGPVIPPTKRRNVEDIVFCFVCEIK